MDKLIEVLEARRLAAGRNGKPKGYINWAKGLGIEASQTYKFCTRKLGKNKTLGLSNIRVLAKVAKTQGDNELLFALAGYVLDVEFPTPTVDN
jgi:hypothetical protein